MGMIVMTFVCLFILCLLPFPSRCIFPCLVNHTLGKTALLSQALTSVICRSVYIEKCFVLQVAKLFSFMLVCSLMEKSLKEILISSITAEQLSLFNTTVI